MKKIEELTINDIPDWFQRRNPEQKRKKLTFQTFESDEAQIRGVRLEQFAKKILEMLEHERKFESNPNYKTYKIEFDDDDHNTDDDSDFKVIKFVEIVYLPETDAQYLERFKNHVQQEIKTLKSLEKTIENLLK